MSLDKNDKTVISQQERKTEKKAHPTAAGLSTKDSPYLYETLTCRNKSQWKMKPWQGVVVFVCLLVLFQLIGGLLLLVFGLYANGIAEMIFFFGGSLLTARLFRISFREVFPVKKPEMQGIFGTMLIWFGAYQCMTALSLVLAVLFPQAYDSAGTSINMFVTGFSFLGSVLVVALVPAVSEEMLHRGILQYTLQPLGKKWLIIVLMGVYFGVFHLSFIRFLPMMFLGMVLAWLRQESGNMIYGMLFHFINNFYALAVTFLNEQVFGSASSQSYSIPLYLMGYYFLIAAAGPFLLYLGGWLVKRSVTGRRLPLLRGGKKTVTAIAVPTILLAAAGLVLFVVGISAYL